jgi:hypothetical protein
MGGNVVDVGVIEMYTKLQSENLKGRNLLQDLSAEERTILKFTIYIYIYVHTHTHTHTLYVCVCVCACVRACACVCVCVFV